MKINPAVPSLSHAGSTVTNALQERERA